MTSHAKMKRETIIERIEARQTIIECLKTTKGGKTKEQISMETGMTIPKVEETLRSMCILKIVRINGPKGLGRYVLRDRDGGINIRSRQPYRSVQSVGIVRNRDHGRTQGRGMDGQRDPRMP